MRADKVAYWLLKNITEIDNELSGAYPFVIPQSVSIVSGNFATYSIINTDAITTKTSFNDYDRVTIQISLFSSDLDAIENLAAIVRRNIERYQGRITIDSITYGIDIIQFENQEFVGFDEANGVYMIAQDWLFSLYRVFIIGQPSPCFLDGSAAAGVDLNVVDYPLLWVEGNYYDTYKDNVFQIDGSACVWGGSQSDYDAVTTIELDSQSLTTDFTLDFFNRFKNLISIFLFDNFISILKCEIESIEYLVAYKNNISVIDLTKMINLDFIALNLNNLSSIDLSKNTLATYINLDSNNLNQIDVSKNTLLSELRISGNNIGSLNLTNNVNLTLLRALNNEFPTLDISNCPLLTTITWAGGKLDNLAVSQVLIDLDANGQTNGVANGSIFGGGSLTAAGLIAKSNLQAKGWVISGI